MSGARRVRTGRATTALSDRDPRPGSTLGAPARRGARRRAPIGDRRRRALPVVVLAALAFLAGVLFGAGHDTSAQALAQRFAAAWARGDYAKMYSEVDRATRQRVSAADFAGQYLHADATSTATHYRVGHAGSAQGAMVTVPTIVKTRIFGRIAAAFHIRVAGQGAGARVLWSPTLLFPGLAAGETLSRTTTLARRAALLTREGVVLASGASAAGGQRPSPLGPAATAITGILGAIPKARTAELYAAGYPPDAKVGLDGLERAFEPQLSGTPGGQLRAGGRVLSSSTPRPGHAVHTTISARLQRAAVSTLGSQVGAIAVLRPSAGEILALAGIPLSGLQPPGSTFKMITVTGVLEAHLATPKTVFAVRTSAVLSGVTLGNANGESCGGTLANAFAVSCNSVFAPLGAKLGARRLVDVAKRFGFNSPPGIPGAATSLIPAPSRIPDDLAAGSTAIGQGDVQATALQMGLVAATIGLGGRRPIPTIALGRAAHYVRATSPAVARTVEQLMLGVVRSGTGTAAAIPGVRVAGKTGTAELRSTVCSPGQSNCAGSNDPRNTDAWFAAEAPAGHPRVAVGILLVGAGAGGASAAPLARQMLLAGLHR